MTAGDTEGSTNSKLRLDTLKIDTVRSCVVNFGFMVFGSQLDGIKILILPFLEFQIIQIFPGSMGTLEPFLSLSSANLSKDFWYYCILYIDINRLNRASI